VLGDDCGWGFADIWERVADRFPSAPAELHGDHVLTWADFDQQADGIGRTLVARGANRQDKIALYLYNCPEYLASMFGCFKAGLVPFNTNFRYTGDELAYLWTNADAIAVVFHADFAAQCERLRHEIPAITTWIWVPSESAPAGTCPDWAIAYADAAADRSGRFLATWGRTPDDVCMLYTGGTTGRPKGVLWRQDDIIGGLDSASRRPLPACPGWEDFDLRVKGPGPRNLPAAPLMHGTGAFNAMWALCLGGSVVTTAVRSFDPAHVLDTIDRYAVKSVTIAGDTFCKPILRLLAGQPDRWQLRSLRFLYSSGVMWSAGVKEALLRRLPGLTLIDSYGSSEAIGVAASVQSVADPASVARTATFRLGANTCVLDEDGTEIAPGSGSKGRIAVRGRIPLGYYKDPEKSAQTFVVHRGERWSIPGDWAEVNEDGTLRLLGRGSQCINTGGEKVFPEEVEEVLKLQEGIVDAAVVGVPDDRFGEAVSAVIQVRPGFAATDDDLRQHMRTTLAGYKLPRHFVRVGDLHRAPNGKLDYARLARLARDSVAGEGAAGDGAVHADAACG
jgi:acyl-CoA synthetase (AMP-forming)/AMP-acid ligase II